MNNLTLNYVFLFFEINVPSNKSLINSLESILYLLLFSFFIISIIYYLIRFLRTLPKNYLFSKVGFMLFSLIFIALVIIYQKTIFWHFFVLSSFMIAISFFCLLFITNGYGYKKFLKINLLYILIFLCIVFLYNVEIHSSFEQKKYIVNWELIPIYSETRDLKNLKNKKQIQFTYENYSPETYFIINSDKFLNKLSKIGKQEIPITFKWKHHYFLFKRKKRVLLSIIFNSIEEKSGMPSIVESLYVTMVTRNPWNWLSKYGVEE